MADGDFFQTESNDLADASAFVVDGSSGGTGAAEVHEIWGTASADIYKEVDPDADGTFEISFVIDTIGSGGEHVQKQQIEVNSSDNVRLRIVNTSGATADYSVNGMEIQA